MQLLSTKIGFLPFSGAFLDAGYEYRNKNEKSEKIASACDLKILKMHGIGKLKNQNGKILLNGPIIGKMMGGFQI